MLPTTESNSGSLPTTAPDALVVVAAAAPVPAPPDFVLLTGDIASAGVNVVTEVAMDADRLFARLEKTLRRLAGISQEDPAVALQLAAYLRRASMIAESSHQNWLDTYGDVICEVVGVECGESCGFHA